MIDTKNSFKKNQNGITLLALIVTIIVLLILSGISIAMLTGENGIYNNAVKAKKAMNTASIIEKIKLSITSAQIKGLGKVDETELKKELTNYFGTEGTGYTIEGDTENGWTVNVPRDDVTYVINASGSLDTIDNSKSLILGLVDDLDTKSTIYLYNNTKNIKSGTITITLPDSTTQTITAIEDTSEISDTANYYAYTVSKNGTYTFKTTDGTNETETKVIVNNIEKFTKVDDLGLAYVNSENKAYSYKGVAVPKGYYVDTKSEVNTGLVVTDEIDSEGYSTGNEWVWVPVNSTVGNADYYLTGSGNMAGAETVSYTKYSKLWNFTTNPTTGETTRADLSFTQAQPSATSGFREPAILTDDSYGETGKYSLVNSRTAGTAFTNVTDVATQYRDDYESMVESVDKYKGFYIGRYEITANGEKPGASLTNTSWYTFYNKSLEYGKTNTESGMIYGCLWDATMQWLAKSNYSVGYTGNTYSGYGNYNSEAVKVKNNNIEITVKKQGANQKLQTGQTSYTKSNNIYDLSGNCWDWTQEATGTSTRVCRGGWNGDGGSYGTYSASRTYYYPNSTYANVSSRPHFYIK